MSKNFCIANWKMYLDSKQSISFIDTFKKNNFNKNCKVIICPSFIRKSHKAYQ